MRCDLHTHSMYSDGTYTPEEIIYEAKRLGLAVALTDHNTTLGLGEFIKAADEQSVTAVAGVEISTEYDGKELHLIGLFISPENYCHIEQMCKDYFLVKEKSNIEMVERLKSAGYEIEYSDVKKRNFKGNVNRAHVAAELVDKGYVSSINEAFLTLLDEKKGFYVPPAYLKTTDVISELRKINALAVLAHPLKDVDEKTLCRILPDFIEAGLCGMETLHSSYNEKTVLSATGIADKFGILPSGGSDFHGKNKPGISLGECNVPYEFYEKLKKKATE